APDRLFPDIDRAIEWAEDDLLRQTAPTPASEWPLERLPLVGDFTADQIEHLRNWLEPAAWLAGEVVFRSGDPGSSLYLVTQGRASVRIRHDGGVISLVTFAPGAGFGELALLDHGPRSAPIQADDDLKALRLAEASFAVLRQWQ